MGKWNPYPSKTEAASWRDARSCTKWGMSGVTDLLISNGSEHGHEVYPVLIFAAPTLSRKYRRQGRPMVTHCLRQPLFHISLRSEARA
jgi:hypothetical protein